MKRTILAAALLAALTAPAVAKPCLLNWYEKSLKAEAESPERDAPVITVGGSGRTCGSKTSFLDTYDRQDNLIEIKTAHKKLVLMPVALYRKTEASTCNRIKLRNACHTRKDNDDGSVEITLYDPDRETKAPATFTVTRLGHIRGHYPEYALLRARFGPSNNRFLPTRINERILDFSRNAKSCAGSKVSPKCRVGREAVAEAASLELLRAQRFPRILSQADIDSDNARLLEGLSGLSGVRRIIHLMFAKTESGKTSPYEVSDATLEASALSFGIRQLDIGGNKDAKRIFKANLTDTSGDPEWESIDSDREFVFSPSFLAPIRDFAPEQLYAMHRAIPAIDKSMRRPAAMERYNAHHAEFLNAEAARYKLLRQECLFKDSPLLALMMIDRANQRPADYKRMLEKVRSYCRQGLDADEATRGLAKVYGQYADRAKKIEKLIAEEGFE